jgi:hypothetical protein
MADLKPIESIIKRTEIVGPKVPESFNVLVKELQGLGLKVDLVHSDKVIDAEKILASNIKDEAEHLPTVDVPQPLASDVDVTEEVSGDDFTISTGEDDNLATETMMVEEESNDTATGSENEGEV